jgi:hypothetical protein
VIERQALLLPLENRILALTWAFSILRRLAHTG